LNFIGAMSGPVTMKSPRTRRMASDVIAPAKPCFGFLFRVKAQDAILATVIPVKLSPPLRRAGLGLDDRPDGMACGLHG
jgi:hypothetical protein